MENNNIEDELTSIRSLMERSSKFISLSGMSGVMAGIYALVGAGLAYKLIPAPILSSTVDVPQSTGAFADNNFDWILIAPLMIIAFAVLTLAMSTGIILSYRKAKRNGQTLWTTTSRALLFHSAIPLLTGGLFMLILLNRGYYGVVAPASLIFYGLAEVIIPLPTLNTWTF